MKVLFVINSLKTGGAEKLLADSIALFQKKGTFPELLLLNGTITPLLEKLRAQNEIPIHVLGNGSVYNPLHIFKMMFFVGKYDMIHVHLFPSLYYMALAKMLCFSNNALIYTEHSSNNRRRKKIMFRLLDRLLYRQYNRIITIGEAVDSELRQHLNFPTHRFELIPNGVDTHLYEAAKPYPKNVFFGPDDKILIQVSSFRPPKDQMTVIRTLKLLPDQVKLLFVGDGPLKKECELEADRLGLADRIQFLGMRMDVPELLKTADIVVLSSAYEGLSLSSIEGMACGKPFIATDVPGLHEIVNGAGLLFELGNEKELAAQVTPLLSDEGYYNATASKCIIRARKFDIGIMVEAYLDLYRKALKEVLPRNESKQF